MKAGSWDEAIRLLDEALLFMPQHADAAYLRSLCGWYLNEPIVLLKPFLETALTSDSFFYYSKADAGWLMAVFQIQLGHYATALRFLETLPPEARVLRLRVEALRLSGRSAELHKELHHLLDRYPEEADVLVPWLQTLDEDYRQPDVAKLVDRALALLPLLKADNPDLMLALVPFVPDTDERRFLLREYRATHPAKARATRLALQYGLINDTRAVNELFSSSFLPDYADLQSLFPLLKDDTARAHFASVFSNYSGKLVSDANKDGYNELILEYAQGQPRYLAADSDQDGQVDIEIWFEGGQPQTAMVIRGSTILQLEYQPWPWLSAMRIFQGSSTREYEFSIGRLPAALIARQNFASGPYGTLQLIHLQLASIPTEQNLLMSARKVEENTAKWQRSASLHLGLPLLSIYKDRYGLVSQAWHDDTGMVRSELLDLDGDGYFNARKIWRMTAAGIPQALYLDVDSNGDRFFDYRELLIAPFTRSWDLDRDGRFDLALTSDLSGRQFYQFSSQSDGRFDRTVEYQAGRIYRAYKGDQALELTSDSNPKVIWLGQKGFDFGSRTPVPGWHATGSVRYYVMPIAGLLYVEILD